VTNAALLLNSLNGEHTVVYEEYKKTTAYLQLHKMWDKVEMQRNNGGIDGAFGRRREKKEGQAM